MLFVLNFRLSRALLRAYRFNIARAKKVPKVRRFWANSQKYRRPKTDFRDQWQISTPERQN